MSTDLVRIQGLQETLSALDRAPSVIVAKAFSDALKAAAQIFEAYVLGSVPALTGELRSAVISNIAIDLISLGGSAAAGFSRYQKTAEGVPMDLLAVWVNYGFELTSHKGNPIRHVEGQGFMQRAAIGAHEPALEAFTETLSNAIDSLGNI